MIEHLSHVIRGAVLPIVALVIAPGGVSQISMDLSMFYSQTCFANSALLGRGAGGALGGDEIFGFDRALERSVNFLSDEGETECEITG